MLAWAVRTGRYSSLFIPFSAILAVHRVQELLIFLTSLLPPSVLESHPYIFSHTVVFLMPPDIHLFPIME